MRNLLLCAAAGACLAATAAEGAASRFLVPANPAPRLLAMHNAERGRLRVAPLRWDPALAASAAAYGRTLARLGRLQHSPRGGRPGQIENLWMGTRGAFSPEQMVGSWISERAYYRPRLGSQSSTGNWRDVSHYVALTSQRATRVGCAIQSSAQWDFLICRYGRDFASGGRSVAAN